MAATGFTPIQLYRTSTASAVPVNTDLADGELAINLTDEKLYFKNAAGTVKLLAANLTPVANGGTGVTTSTGTGSVVLSTSPTLVTPALGTPSSGTLTNATGLPIVAGTTGTLSVARGGTGVTTSTGTGNVVLSNSPTLVTPALGTPSSGTLTNATGLPISTGVSGLGTGVATFLATPSSANLAAAVTDETGTGALVFAGSPALTGTPTAPTATIGTNTTQIASTAFVINQIGAISAGVTSFSTGTTGLTPSAATSGAVTLAGTLAIANGGTGATTNSAARTNLGATTLGSNLFTITNPSAVTFPRFNADNTVSALDAATFRSAIGAGTGGGTVTSVGGTGTVNGITLTGTVTSSGNLTLGGTLSGVSLSTQVTGTLPIANGGTGATTQQAALNALSGTLTANRVLRSDGTNVTLSQVALATDVSGTLPVANGGTGVTTSTGSGSVVLSTSPALTTPNLGTPSAATLTNATGLPLSTGVTGTLPVANGGTGATTLTANNVLLGNGTSALQVVAPGTSGNVLTSNGTTWTSAALAASKAADVQTFNASGTWTKPSGYSADSRVFIQCWGGGGSGGFNAHAGGGGGGSYFERWINLADLGATVTVTVGAGGAARTTTGAGNVGGTSSFGSVAFAYGGGGGAAGVNNAQSGGLGGGWVTAGSTGTGTSASQVGKPFMVTFSENASGQLLSTAVQGSNAPTSTSVIRSVWHGGAGGSTYVDACFNNFTGPGQQSTYGGGGGGARGTAGVTAGGTSLVGGSGGAGGAGAGTAGTAPAGGGGGGQTTTSGAGAAGRIIITVFDGV